MKAIKTRELSPRRCVAHVAATTAAADITAISGPHTTHDTRQTADGRQENLSAKIVNGHKFEK